MSSGVTSAFSQLIPQAANNVSVSLTIDGVDLTDAIDPSLLEVSYKQTFDSTSHADSLQIRIADPQGLFRQQFKFSPQMPVTCTFTINKWSNGTFTPSVLTKTVQGMWVKRTESERAKDLAQLLRLIALRFHRRVPFA